jgi:hypothetical protein
MIGRKYVPTPEYFEAIIADLMKQNQRLVIQNSILQTKVQTADTERKVKSTNS